MEPHIGKIKVLIVEDDFLITEEILRIIKKLGYYHAGTASNGEKAIELSSILKPDVIIMDIKMPKMDGLEAARNIANENNQVAIIILTAHESHDLIEEASQSGVAAYLTKPPKSEEIERAIYIALARQRDLIKSQKLVKELEEHKHQLAELNATKDRFFSILAHDMRNPVSALYTFSGYLNENSKEISTVDLHQYLSVIHTTARSLSELLEELFLWANLRSNRYEFEPKTLLLTETIDNVLSLLQASAIQKNIQLENHIPSGFYVYSDKNMIQTIVRNLVLNAIKFTPQKGRVTIAAIENQDEIIISVNDTGVGIEKEELRKLFKIDEQFTNTGTNGETGSGLGLVLCKDMVEINKGKIWVESKPGKGSSFIFSLPKGFQHE